MTELVLLPHSVQMAPVTGAAAALFRQTFPPILLPTGTCRAVFV